MWDGHGEMRNVYNIFARKPEEMTPLGRPRHRWEGNIRMDLGEKLWEGVDWTHLAQERDQWWTLGNIVMNLQIP
jgi:hypothetical protein